MRSVIWDFSVPRSPFWEVEVEGKVDSAGLVEAVENGVEMVVDKRLGWWRDEWRS